MVQFSPCVCVCVCLVCRWVKFEEKVEEGGERWSKPHVSTLSLHSLFELRTCLQTGTVLLDLDGYSLPQIVGEDPPPPAEKTAVIAHEFPLLEDY